MEGVVRSRLGGRTTWNHPQGFACHAARPRVWRCGRASTTDAHVFGLVADPESVTVISRPSALPWLRERSGISSAGGSPDDGPTVGSGRIPRYDSHSAPGVRHTNGRLSDLAGVSVVSSAGPPVSAGACGSSPASGAGAPTVRAGGCDGVGSRAAPVHGAPSGAGPPSSSTWFRRPAEHASRSSSNADGR